jgi:hypothetical protein
MAGMEPRARDEYLRSFLESRFAWRRWLVGNLRFLVLTVQPLGPVPA